ncbi:MAG: SEC-C metal-binding domain-containing protein [Bryobacteraceae bacterium]|nr:SEC-C metal-binding domain-containing protein [Bryobacteraceae bacterium]
MLILPEQYGQTPALRLLEEAERGRIGFDQRLIRSLLARPEETLDALEKFLAQPPREEAVADLTEQVFDLYRALRSPRALPFYLDLLRNAREGVPDELVEAFHELGAAAVEPLLEAYEAAPEDERPDVLFVLASLGVPHPRIRGLVAERIGQDPYEGALCASLCRDAELLPALREALAALPPGDSARHERKALEEAIEALEKQEPREEPEPFDILPQYPEQAPPLFDHLSHAELVEFLDHPDAEFRARAARSFADEELDETVRRRLLKTAREDADPRVRGEALRGLSACGADPEVFALLNEVLRDRARPAEEWSGALVALAEPDAGLEVRRAAEEAWERKETRAAALEAMWRLRDRRYLRQIAAGLKDPDPDVAREAIRAVGVLPAEELAIELVPFFQNEDLREDALFSYALAVRHETTPKSVRRLFERIAERAGGLTDHEEDVVASALDMRLEREGYRPVFFPEEDAEPEEGLAGRPGPAKSQKVGRNDPCPCGSGKKYKKCCGA